MTTPGTNPRHDARDPWPRRAGVLKGVVPADGVDLCHRPPPRSIQLSWEGRHPLSPEGAGRPEGRPRGVSHSTCSLAPRWPSRLQGSSGEAVLERTTPLGPGSNRDVHRGLGCGTFSFFPLAHLQGPWWGVPRWACRLPWGEPDLLRATKIPKGPHGYFVYKKACVPRVVLPNLNRRLTGRTCWMTGRT